MRTLRRILFWLFLAVYLVATPIAILYATGYLYKPGSERGLATYGLISIGSTPDDAQIFLGESRFARRTPAVLRDLLPGRYNVRLFRNGYEPWQGSIAVAAERATVLDRIILLPAKRQPVRIAQGPWTDLCVEPGDRSILLIRGPRLGDWARLDAARMSVHPLLATNSPWADLQVARRWLVANSPHVLVEGQLNGAMARLWLRADAPEDEPADITRLFPEPPDDIVWDPRARTQLYAGVRDRIHRIDLKDRALYPDFAEAGRGFALYKNRLLVLGDSNALLRVDRDGERSPTDYMLPDALRERLRATRYRIMVLPDDRALFLDAEGALLINQPPHTLAPAGIRAVLPANGSDQWLAMGDRALARLTIGRFAERDLRWDVLYEHPEPIQRAEWIHNDTHIIFSAGGQLHLLALERGGGIRVRALGPVHREGAFHFSDASGLLYALDPAGHLVAVRLLPPDSLIPLPRHLEVDE